MTEDLGMGQAPEEIKEQMSPAHIAPIVCWLSSPESAHVTGRVFDVTGRMISVSEGWHRGPTLENPTDDPAELGPEGRRAGGPGPPQRQHAGLRREVGDSTMPINPDAVGTKSEPARRKWTRKDALIYALGVGAGAVDPLDELEFTTENTSDKPQRVLPTMAVVLGPLGGAFGAIGTFNPAMLVHGEQGITLHREIPVEGELEAVSEITGIYDKGKGAVVVTESKAIAGGHAASRCSTPACRPSSGARAAGAATAARRAPPNAAPEREPDHSVTVQTRTDQALIYRLSGDRNPLHSDPAFAAMGGFDRPILHGLCTYGFTGRALLHALCGSDPARFKGMDARFASPVMPGEALTVKAWDDGDGSADLPDLRRRRPGRHRRRPRHLRRLTARRCVRTSEVWARSMPRRSS